VFDSISVSVNTFVPGQQDFAYTSSVDQEPMRGLLYVPPTYTAGGSPTALVCFLHGGGGCGTLPQGWSTELDARRWIYIAPHGRLWALADPTTCGGTNANVCEGGPNPNAAGGCNWCISAAYVDNPFDPMVGPGEQDILDAIDWAVSSFNIDPDRIYLTGFSMGGRGTYQIGLRNPDRFAAIAPLGPASDMYEVFVRRPDPPECKEGMVSDGAGGGQPGDSLITDTFYSITSGRFLIENAFNLPVFHGHGTSDCTACNIPPATEPCMNALNGVCPGTQGPAPAGVAQYRHGFHMLFDTSWSDCHWSGNLCFGHTPTLSELRARHPSGYDWGYVFTNAAHQNDLFFATGGAPSATNEGVPSLANPGELMGMFEFFDTRTLVHSPDTIVYKSYTDTDRSAYWAAIDITTPWQDTPGAIRATRSTGSNSLGMELSRVGTATIDLALAQLQLSPATPLGLSLQPLNEPVYDPALMDAVGPLAPTIVLKGSFSNAACVNVAPSAGSPPAVSFTATTVTIGPVSVTQPLTLAVSVFDYGDFDADGAVSSSDIPPFVDALLGSGAPPACPALADMNRDGSIDGLDISPFVSAIAGP
jgi:predicted esterase